MKKVFLSIQGNDLQKILIGAFRKLPKLPKHVFVAEFTQYILGFKKDTYLSFRKAPESRI